MLLFGYIKIGSAVVVCLFSLIGSLYCLLKGKMSYRLNYLALGLCMLSLACLTLLSLWPASFTVMVLYCFVFVVFVCSALVVLFYFRTALCQLIRGGTNTIDLSTMPSSSSDPSSSASQLAVKQKELEQEIGATDRLRQRMQSIFESAPNGMLVVRKNGIIAQANTLAESIFRYPKGGMVGLSVEELVPREHRHQHQSDRDGYVKAPTKRMMGDRRDLYGVCFDGHKVPVEIGLNPIEGSAEQDIVATIVDISERKKYQGFIERRNTDLENSNRELEEFTFIASHDLREPLRKIIAFSRLLQSDDYGSFSPEGHEYSGYVVGAAERMRTLLDSLLSYSRVTSTASHFEATDLSTLVDDVCADLELVIAEEKATISVEPLATIEVDASKMRQVIQNLIGNAIKYRRPDTPPEIIITGEQTASSYRLKIQDNGIGFEMAYAEQIFEVFKRLHDRSQYQGTGMGLAICRKIIARHQGRIWAQSSEGVGSQFFIELPLVMPKEPLSE